MLVIVGVLYVELNMSKDGVIAGDGFACVLL